ncbi:unnamed protein product (macronuclear) [Paramecium tetraurelia]|uniref:Transmembrane protein n=1 Tax=Paramecium tetraurelia TaxID=5888 RepID=A0C189_PARTE|nr:uncharacterized protein GSPATT00034032001 [Paramecium tetraurelia]CAK64556.1 unnamed protein product [Paramecium tetraurelia]|eukprot:XP_001431954.1 hypothetical protein (macronuclear) [Paramecium tetraurelia strain d4-2]
MNLQEKNFILIRLLFDYNHNNKQKSQIKASYLQCFLQAFSIQNSCQQHSPQHQVLLYQTIIFCFQGTKNYPDSILFSIYHFIHNCSIAKQGQYTYFQSGFHITRNQFKGLTLINQARTTPESHIKEIPFFIFEVHSHIVILIQSSFLLANILYQIFYKSFYFNVFSTANQALLFRNRLETQVPVDIDILKISIYKGGSRTILISSFPIKIILIQSFHLRHQKLFMIQFIKLRLIRSRI